MIRLHAKVQLETNVLTAITSVKKFPVGGGRDDGGGGIGLGWSTDIVESNHPRDLDQVDKRGATMHPR